MSNRLISPRPADEPVMNTRDIGGYLLKMPASIASRCEGFEA
jgi:hypothetical protein